MDFAARPERSEDQCRATVQMPVEPVPRPLFGTAGGGKGKGNVAPAACSPAFLLLGRQPGGVGQGGIQQQAEGFLHPAVAGRAAVLPGAGVGGHGAVASGTGGKGFGALMRGGWEGGSWRVQSEQRRADQGGECCHSHAVMIAGAQDWVNDVYTKDIIKICFAALRARGKPNLPSQYGPLQFF